MRARVHAAAESALAAAVAASKRQEAGAAPRLDKEAKLRERLEAQVNDGLRSPGLVHLA